MGGTAADTRAANANSVAVQLNARLRGDINKVQVESADQGLTGTRAKGDSARPHPVDVAVAWWSRRSALFVRGWGDEAVLEEFSDRARYLAAPDPVNVEWRAIASADAKRAAMAHFRRRLTVCPMP